MDGSEHVLVGSDGPIGRLILNRPEKLNSFFGDMRDRIAEVLEAWAATTRSAS